MKFHLIAKILILLFSLFFKGIIGYSQCNQPTGIMVSDITSVSAVLNWSASTSAPGIAYSFEVRSSGLPGSGVSGLVDSGSVGDGVFSSQLSGLLSNTTYTVYMRFQCTSAPLFSSWTTGLIFSTNTISVPIAGSPSGVSDTFFSARWIAVPGATGFRLDVSEFSDFSVMLVGYNNLFIPGGSTSKIVDGLNPSTNYYYRLRAEGNSGSGPVTSENSNVIMVTTFDEPTFVAVWSDGAWLNGILPTSEHDVILDDNFVSDENNTTLFEVKSITLNEGHSYTITSGNNLIVYENIVNNSNATSFVIQNNANLFQLNDNALPNIGEITILRNSSEIFRLDYTMWSSPVFGSQTLKQFSPQTVDTRFYEYNTSDNIYSPINPYTTLFDSGRGYFIRSPNNHVANNGSNAPQVWTGNFVGIPRNGEVIVSLETEGQGFNLVGNPYPTVISADQFLQENAANIEGTIYFWRRLNDSTGVGPLGSFYATYTEFGGTGSSTSEDPNGFIQIGQGFLVKALSSELFFNSGMKVPDEFENQFFRYSTTNQDVKHRLWLTLTNQNGVFCKLLLGYSSVASNDLDRYDGKYINDSEVVLTSLINNQEFVIQAKALPFSNEDYFSLGLKIASSGEYKIAIEQMDGLFADGQLVYLEDTYTATIHPLNESDYVFSSVAGAFNDRFILRFTDEVMNVEQPYDESAISIQTQDNSLIIYSKFTEINSIKIYDLQGRILFNRDQINSKDLFIESLSKDNQLLIIQIEDQNENTFTKKVIF